MMNPTDVVVVFLLCCTCTIQASHSGGHDGKTYLEGLTAMAVFPNSTDGLNLTLCLSDVQLATLEQCKLNATIKDSKAHPHLITRCILESANGVDSDDKVNQTAVKNGIINMSQLTDDEKSIAGTMLDDCIKLNITIPNPDGKTHRHRFGVRNPAECPLRKAIVCAARSLIAMGCADVNQEENATAMDNPLLK